MPDTLSFRYLPPRSATADTMLNEQSSRSHAILTLHIEQHLLRSGSAAPSGASTPRSGGAVPLPVELAAAAAAAGGVLEYRCAKFHLVDLGGSERVKKSGVTGARLQEAVCINQVRAGRGVGHNTVLTSQHWR